jgi:cardiolipin synthase C
MRLICRMLFALAIAPEMKGTAEAVERPIETALAVGQHAPLDRSLALREARHPGESAFRLLSEGDEAFVVRSHSAQLAMRSLDIQTFIWRFDLTGKFLAHRVLEAADRGVRVRLLVDDMDARDNHDRFAALTVHPNIAVRIFNPFVSRHGILRLIGEGLLDFKRLNRRMHNKSWVVDNRVAIVGGRNLGDAYFNASEAVNFVDLDFVMFGPIVRDTSRSFDDYWNSSAAHPIEKLDPAEINEHSLASLRIELSEAAAAAWNSRYADALRADDGVQRLLNGDWPMQWSAHYRFTADDPRKATTNRHAPQHAYVRQTLLHAVRGLRTDLVLISPYFVPGEDITEFLSETVKGNRRVRVLTNSLVATDVSAVHGGYSRYRRALLDGGIELWELKPSPENTSQHFRDPAGASLHTKALLIDRSTLFVGSYNLDPRSAWLNCEQGVLVESGALAQEMADLFARQTDGQRAWQVKLENGAVSWSDGASVFDTDPHSSLAQRLQARLVRILRIEPHL